jgi:hypothetical protein
MMFSDVIVFHLDIVRWFSFDFWHSFVFLIFFYDWSVDWEMSCSTCPPHGGEKKEQETTLKRKRKKKWNKELIKGLVSVNSCYDLACRFVCTRESDAITSTSVELHFELWRDFFLFLDEKFKKKKRIFSHTYIFLLAFFYFNADEKLLTEFFFFFLYNNNISAKEEKKRNVYWSCTFVYLIGNDVHVLKAPRLLLLSDELVVRVPCLPWPVRVCHVTAGGIVDFSFRRSSPSNSLGCWPFCSHLFPH